MGVLQDDALNGVKAFDVKLGDMLDSLETTLEKHDHSHEGALSWPQFRASMEELNKQRHLKLNKREIINLYRLLLTGFLVLVGRQPLPTRQLVAAPLTQPPTHSFTHSLYRFGNKDAEGRLAFKAWMEGFRNTTGVHAMRSVPEFLKPKASRCSVHGSPWQWAETPKESLTIHKVCLALSLETCSVAAGARAELSCTPTVGGQPVVFRAVRRHQPQDRALCQRRVAGHEERALRHAASARRGDEQGGGSVGLSISLSLSRAVVSTCGSLIGSQLDSPFGFTH